MQTSFLMVHVFSNKPRRKEYGAKNESLPICHPKYVNCVRRNCPNEYEVIQKKIKDHNENGDIEQDSNPVNGLFYAPTQHDNIPKHKTHPKI